MDQIPLWAKLAFAGGVGGLVRYNKAGRMGVQDLLTHVGLGVVLGIFLTGTINHEFPIIESAQVVLALGIGGSSVFIYDVLAGLVQGGVSKAAVRADREINAKMESDREKKP